MSNSNKLRKTHTKFGGGKHIFNSKALAHEIKMFNVVQILIEELEFEYPDINFIWQKSITKIEMGKKINSKYIPQNKKSFVSPDGGILSIDFGGGEIYPILISEAKKQGTNDIRKVEGLGKQAKGNAIERVYKNVEELKLYFSNLNYFPYVVFAFGCDFEPGSSILDRLDALTKYKDRNVNYFLMGDQTTTVYVKSSGFTLKEMYSIMKMLAISSIENLIE